MTGASAASGGVTLTAMQVVTRDDMVAAVGGSLKLVPGATGTVTITPRLLQCSVQPQNSPLLLVSGSTIPGKVTYTAEFTYTAPSANGVVLSWEYKTHARDTC